VLQQSPNIKITCRLENGLPYTVFGHFERFPLIHLLLILESEKNLFVSQLVFSILESSLPTNWNKDQDMGLPTWYSTSLQPPICGFLLYVPKTVLK